MVKAGFRRLTLPFREGLSIAMFRQKRKDSLRTPLYANSVYLMANPATTAVLRFRLLRIGVHYIHPIPVERVRDDLQVNS